MEKTANQWKKLGFVPKDGTTGVERTQQFGSRYLVRELKNEFCDRNYHLNLEGCS